MSFATRSGKTSRSPSVSVVVNCYGKNCLIQLKALSELISHRQSGVNNMSKEHKNKRDDKKKPALSPKEKKAAKLAKKDAKNVLGN